MNQLPGKVSKNILVIGSSSFVGRALIKDLSTTNNIICIDKKRAKKILPKNVIYFQSDVKNIKKLSLIKKKIQKKIKKIDIIINCFVEQNYLSFEL